MEIIQRLRDATQEFTGFCMSIDEQSFFHQPPGKWSIAQHVQHLVIAARSTRPAFSLPRFIVKLYTGKPNRPSRSYDELVDKYTTKLQQGEKASGRFVPEAIDPATGKLNMLALFDQAMGRLMTSLEKNRDDASLDKLLAPHPLLGKITLRELGYFTIYHTHHHLHIIRERVEHPIEAGRE